MPWMKAFARRQLGERMQGSALGCGTIAHVVSYLVREYRRIQHSAV